jgi:hypothetical protein
LRAWQEVIDLVIPYSSCVQSNPATLRDLKEYCRRTTSSTSHDHGHDSIPTSLNSNQLVKIFNNGLSNSQCDLANSKELGLSTPDIDCDEDLGLWSWSLSPDALAASIVQGVLPYVAHTRESERGEESEPRSLGLISRYNATAQWVFDLGDYLEHPTDWEDVVLEKVCGPFSSNSI